MTDEAPTPAKPRRGRPPKEASSEPGTITLSVRVRSDLRKALEVESKAKGMSLSEVSELWMTRGRFALPLDELPLAQDINVLFARLIALYRAVVDLVGDVENEELAQAALSAGVAEIVSRFSFRPTLTSEQRARIRLKSDIRLTVRELRQFHLTQHPDGPPLPLTDVLEAALQNKFDDVDYDVFTDYVEMLQRDAGIKKAYQGSLPRDLLFAAATLQARAGELIRVADEALMAFDAGSNYGRDIARAMLQPPSNKGANSADDQRFNWSVQEQVDDKTGS